MPNIFKSTDKTELFNLAFAGVVAQGRAAVDDYMGTCVYEIKDPNEIMLKCGIGHCLIEAAMEYASCYRGNFSNLLDELESHANWIDTPDTKLEEFIIDMQLVHDHAFSDAQNSANEKLFNVEFIEIFIAKMTEFAELEFGDDITIDPKLGIIA